MKSVNQTKMWNTFKKYQRLDKPNTKKKKIKITESIPKAKIFAICARKRASSPDCKWNGHILKDSKPLVEKR